VIGREVREGVVDLVDEGEHGDFELALVGRLARIEPGPVVVAGERAEEFEGFGGEVGGHKCAWSVFSKNLAPIDTDDIDFPGAVRLLRNRSMESVRPGSFEVLGCRRHLVFVQVLERSLL
jgi:hypothetical protein